MMKKILFIGGLLLGFCGLTEAQSGKEKLETAEEKAAGERDRSMGGKRTADYLKDDQNKVNPANDNNDTTANEQTQNDNQVENQDNSQSQEEGQSGQPVGENDSDGLMNANEDEPEQANNSIGNTPDEEKSNAPSVIQQTSSESGSPAVLSNDNGTGRDGTGNVQRAKPNMVGSPVPANMGLADKNVNPENSETGTRVRQQEEQPARTGPNREDTGSQGKGDAQAEQRTQSNRASQQGTTPQVSQQQGSQPDQNDQVKDDSKAEKREARKERRRDRKNRDKDS